MVDPRRVISVGSCLIAPRRGGVAPAGAPEYGQPEPAKEGTLLRAPGRARGCQPRAPPASMRCPALCQHPRVPETGFFPARPGEEGPGAGGKHPWRVAARRGGLTPSALRPKPRRGHGNEPVVQRSGELCSRERQPETRRARRTPRGCSSPRGCAAGGAGGAGRSAAVHGCDPRAPRDPRRAGGRGGARRGHGGTPATLGGAGRRRGPGGRPRRRPPPPAFSTADSAGARPPLQSAGPAHGPGPGPHLAAASARGPRTPAPASHPAAQPPPPPGGAADRRS